MRLIWIFCLVQFVMCVPLNPVIKEKSSRLQDKYKDGNHVHYENFDENLNSGMKINSSPTDEHDDDIPAQHSSPEFTLSENMLVNETHSISDSMNVTEEYTDKITVIDSTEESVQVSSIIDSVNSIVKPSIDNSDESEDKMKITYEPFEDIEHTTSNLYKTYTQFPNEMLSNQNSEVIDEESDNVNDQTSNHDLTEESAIEETHSNADNYSESSLDPWLLDPKLEYILSEISVPTDNFESSGEHIIESSGNLTEEDNKVHNIISEDVLTEAQEVNDDSNIKFEFPTDDTKIPISNSEIIQTNVDQDQFLLKNNEYIPPDPEASLVHIEDCKYSTCANNNDDFVTMKEGSQYPKTPPIVVVHEYIEEPIAISADHIHTNLGPVGILPPNDNYNSDIRIAVEAHDNLEPFVSIYPEMQNPIRQNQPIYFPEQEPHYKTENKYNYKVKENFYSSQINKMSQNDFRFPSQDSSVRNDDAWISLVNKDSNDYMPPSELDQIKNILPPKLISMLERYTPVGYKILIVKDDQSSSEPFHNPLNSHYNPKYPASSRPVSAQYSYGHYRPKLSPQGFAQFQRVYRDSSQDKPYNGRPYRNNYRNSYNTNRYYSSYSSPNRFGTSYAVGYSS